MARDFTPANSEYLDVTAIPNIGSSGSGKLAMSVWFRLDALPTDTQVLVLIADLGSDDYWFRLAAKETVAPTYFVEAHLEGAASPEAVDAESTTAYEANKWHHAFAFFDNTSGTVWTGDVWLDNGGNAQGTDDDINANIYSNPETTVIGAKKVDIGASDFFDGAIAEVALWGNITPSAGMRAALAAGYSPQFFPDGLEMYIPLVRDEDRDKITGSVFTAYNTPTIAPHPPMIYPVPIYGPFIVSPIGGATVGRMYSVSNSVAGVTTAIDLLRISAPSDAVVVVHKVIVTQETEFTDVQSEQMDIQFHRGSTDGSGGATPTARPLEVGDAAFGGTTATGNDTQSTEGVILHAEAANVMAGFVWAPTPEERIVLSPSGRLIVELPTAPDDSIDFRVAAYFEEIGG